MKQKTKKISKLKKNEKNKSCRFPPPHIMIVVQVDYISITFGHLKFVNGLLH
jgi:hypothetical protein